MEILRKLFKVITKLLLIGLAVILIIIVLLLINLGISYYENQRVHKLTGGFVVPTDEEYDEWLKSQPSDIEGMTKYDKSQMGLDSRDGSDTDFDGLTDKEEIEIYKSDPFKKSTAGDLYLDSYKVANGMDLFTYYEYHEEIMFEDNECEEISLVATQAGEQYAEISNDTGFEVIVGYDVYAQYSVYYYAGNLTIDLSDLLETHKLDISDIDILIADVKHARKMEFETDGNIVVTEKVPSMSMFDVYIVGKNPIGSLIFKLMGRDAIIPTVLLTGDDYGEIKSIVFGSPLLETVFNTPTYAYYINLQTDDTNAKLDSTVINSINEELDNEYNPDLKYHVVGTSAYRYQRMKELLYGILPVFEYKEGETPPLWQALFCFFETNIKMNNEDKTEQDSNNFDMYVDELPFENFGSYISGGGNCAGIAHLTSTLYNTGTVPDNGAYTINGETVNWDITTDPENATLLDKGLYDFKTGEFVQNGKIKENLTDGEQEFVNMIGCYWAEGNQNIAENGLTYYRKYKLFDEFYSYDYSLIETIKGTLDDDKILDVYLTVEGGGGHVVNVYGYYEDRKKEDILWLEIYDNNYPQDNEVVLNEGQCVLKITKRKIKGTDNCTFSYEYYPKRGGMFATSNITLRNFLIKKLKGEEKYAMIIVDEDWNILNK